LARGEAVAPEALRDAAPDGRPGALRDAAPDGRPEALRDAAPGALPPALPPAVPPAVPPALALALFDAGLPDALAVPLVRLLGVVMVNPPLALLDKNPASLPTIIPFIP
jgi:hypothetical protein